MIAERRFELSSLAAHAATLLFLLCYFWVLVITALDSAPFYAVFPYRYFVLGVSMVLLLLVPGRDWRLKLGLFLIIAVWFSLLPRVSWHEESHFFINAGTLRKGMTGEQARERMRPFQSTTSPDGTELVFQPGPGSGDRCVVILKGGRVRDIQMRHE